MNFKLLFSLFFLVFLTACGTDTPTDNTISNNATNDTTNSSLNTNSSPTTPLLKFNYNLQAPSAEFELSKNLKEISGLAFYQDKLLAVQDEKGTIFVLDKNSGAVIDDIKFAKKGDFEGIACVEDIVYVLQADGILFKVEDWKDKKKSEGITISTSLDISNNAEGLDYDFVTNNLLIACKGSGAIGQEENSSRSIFSYDLKSAQLNTTPILQISANKIKNFAQKHLAANSNLEHYKEGMLKKDGTLSIAPSAIAVHPIDKNFYILSATGKSLIVMDRNNEILYIERLSKNFEQPEGLAFDSNGDMYISSEGQKEKAKIYVFKQI